MEYDPETPLPDSDIATGVDDNEAETQQTVTKKANRKWTHDDAFSVATMKEGEVERVIVLADLPETSKAYLVYFGLTVYLSRATTTDEIAKAFKRLVDGEKMGVRGSGKTATPKVDFWRQAIAHAFVESTKKAPAGQMTIEAAHEKAKGLDKDRVKKLKLDPVVVKHFNKLSGGTIGYSVSAMLADEAAA